FFFSLLPRPPCSTLFPYTTLFRSLPAFMIRRPDGRFDGLFGEPIRVDASQSTEKAVHAATQTFARQLEHHIRERPHLWYQFYPRSEEHTSELQSLAYLVCRLLLEK